MKRLLIVDDEIAITRALRSMISSAYYETDVFTSNTAQEAVELLQQFHFDVVITDICMPQMSGLELLDVIKRNWPDCYVIVLTAYSEFDYAYAVSKYDNVRFLLKVEEPQTILNAVEHAFDCIDQQINAQYLDEKLEQYYRATDILLSHTLLGKFIFYGRFLSEREILSIQKTLFLRMDEPFLLLRAVTAEQTMQYISYITQTHLRQYELSVTPCFDSGSILFLLQLSPDQPQVDVDRMIHMLYEQLDALLSRMGAYEETAVDFRILDRFVAWKDLPQACSLLYQEASQDTRNEQVIIVSYSSKHSQHISLTLADTIHLKDLLSMRRISTFCTELIQHGYEHSAEAYARLTVSLEWLLAEQFGAILSAPPLQYEQRKQQLRSAFFQSADAYADALEQLLNELFAYNDQQREDRLDMLIKEIDNYILTHLQHSITLAGISESFHYNSSYLSHVYKQKTGEGLSEHVARIRVEHACQYLTSTALNMQQIAELCGFDSAKYFGVTFKRVIGMTPSAWREQHSSENKSIG